MRRPAAFAPLLFLGVAACMGPFRRPDPDPRPAKVPAGVGIFVKNYGGKCRSVLLGDWIRTSCRGQGGGSHHPKERPASDTAAVR